MDYYKILKIDKSADQKAIKKAFRKLAAKFHPDKNPGNKRAEDKFKEINEAYEILGNEEKRKQYDQLGANYEAFKNSGASWEQWQQAQQQRGGFGGGGGGRSYTFSGDPSEFFGRGGQQRGSSGYSSFFEQFFGGGGANFGGAQYRRYEDTQGRDIQAELSITLEEAYHGAKRAFELNGEKMRIKIKPGSEDGRQLRVKGKGHPSPADPNKRGNLYIELRVEPHARFERSGNDLRTTATVPVLDAILGGSVTVSTLSGNVRLKVPAGTQPGKTLRVRGKGMPKYKNPEEFGDLFVKLQLSVPTELTEEERAAYEAIRGMKK